VLCFLFLAPGLWSDDVSADNGPPVVCVSAPAVTCFPASSLIPWGCLEYLEECACRGRQGIGHLLVGVGLNAGQCGHPLRTCVRTCPLVLVAGTPVLSHIDAASLTAVVEHGVAWHSHRYDETEEVKAEELDNIVAWTQPMKEEKLRAYDRSDAICLLAVPNDRAFVLLLASCSHRNVNREAS
jgi:hypothetical protein